MRVVASRPPADAPAGMGPTRDAEALFRSKKIPEIRAVEATTKLEIEEKKEELRQLVGKSYRDLIDSADTIVLMKSSCESISANLDGIGGAIRSLSALADAAGAAWGGGGGGASPARARVYGIASRVKYLVDTSENIWGCLDESMLLEASGRYLRARVVHGLITGGENAQREVLAKFPMLRQLWTNVETLKGQISQRSRERLMERGLAIGAYADALAAVATIDDLDPKTVLSLFLDSRRSWISLKLSTLSNGAVPETEAVSLVAYDVVRIIRSTLGQVGELFLHVLNDLPLFYKTVLGSPPGTQLFGGIANPEEEVKLWKLHREKLESVMVILDPDHVAESSCSWLKSCCAQFFGKMTHQRRLIDGVGTGEGLASAEKLVRELLDSREGLEGSLELWLKNVFGSEIELPWNQIRILVLKSQKDIFEDMLEDAFVERMKEIVSLGFEELNRIIDVKESVRLITVDPGEDNDFLAYLKKPSTGGVWFSEPNPRKAGLGYGFKQTIDENEFRNCLNAYFGPEVSRIRDALDSKCGSILEDLVCFINSHNSTLRLKELAPFLQEKCFTTISILLKELEDELGQLSASLDNKHGNENSQPPSIIVKRSLFIGRLLFAFRNHSSHIPLILGSPRQWVKETNSSMFGNLQSSLSMHSKMAVGPSGPYSPRTQKIDSLRSPRRQSFDNSRKQTISAAAALFPMEDAVKPKLHALMKTLRDLCIKAHGLWISWVSGGLATILSEDLGKDDALSVTTSLRGWEVTMIKQEESSEGPLEMKIALPSMPSLYVTSFLFQACQEIHRVGGHVLDKLILQMFAWRLLDKLVGIYEDFLSTEESNKPQVSEKGVLQILLDLKFAADVLSGGKDPTSYGSEANVKENPSKAETTKSSFRRKHSLLQADSAVSERVIRLICLLSQRLDPIDWATYEPYLWENEKQSYKRYAVLFGFLVQLNRMYTNIVQKLPTKSNTESNILRCSTVPRFKYLPISGPVQSSKGAARSPLPTFPDDGSSRGPWKAYTNGERSPMSEFDDSLGFGVATPLFKSFMTQVGSKFGEGTSRLGLMLTDTQVGKLKDRSAAAMSTFGDILPVPAAGLLSSFTTGGTKSEI